MNDERVFRRLAAATAIISMPVAFAEIALSLAAVNFNLDAWTGDPKTYLAALGNAGAARLAGWTMVADVFGYYLLLAPAMLYLRHWLKQKNSPLVDLYTVSGLGYTLFGAISASFLWGAWPALINDYNTASGAQREMMAAIFSAITQGVQLGVWRMEMILIGVWWVGSGLLLRYERRALGRTAMALGGIALLAATGAIVGIQVVYALGLLVYLLLGPLWTLWLGIALLRKPAGA